MAKKPTIHNHIDNVIIDIDYEQLAKALLKEKSKRKLNAKKRTSVRGLLMGWCNGCLYAALYSYVIYDIIGMWKNYIISGETSLYMCIVYSVAGISMSILFFLAHQETFHDTEDETITHFNTNIGLVALIVALLALFNGVG